LVSEAWLIAFRKSLGVAIEPEAGGMVSRWWRNAGGSMVLPTTDRIGLVAAVLAREHDSLGITEHRCEADVPIKDMTKNGVGGNSTVGTLMLTTGHVKYYHVPSVASHLVLQITL